MPTIIRISLQKSAKLQSTITFFQIDASQQLRAFPRGVIIIISSREKTNILQSNKRMYYEKFLKLRNQQFRRQMKSKKLLQISRIVSEESDGGQWHVEDGFLHLVVGP